MILIIVGSVLSLLLIGITVFWVLEKEVELVVCMIVVSVIPIVMIVSGASLLKYDNHIKPIEQGYSVIQWEFDDFEKDYSNILKYNHTKHHYKSCDMIFTKRSIIKQDVYYIFKTYKDYELYLTWFTNNDNLCINVTEYKGE